MLYSLISGVEGMLCQGRTRPLSGIRIVLLVSSLNDQQETWKRMTFCRRAKLKYAASLKVWQQSVPSPNCYMPYSPPHHPFSPSCRPAPTPLPNFHQSPVQHFPNLPLIKCPSLKSSKSSFLYPLVSPLLLMTSSSSPTLHTHLPFLSP